MLAKALQNIKMYLPLQPAKKGNAMLLKAGEKNKIKFAKSEFISTFAARKKSNTLLLKQRKKL